MMLVSSPLSKRLKILMNLAYLIPCWKTMTTSGIHRRQGGRCSRARHSSGGMFGRGEQQEALYS